MKTLLVCAISLCLFNNAFSQCDSLFFRNTGTLIHDLLLIDSSKIVAVGDNGYVLKSNNGGRTWRNIPTFHPHFLRAIHAPTDSVMYAVGSWKSIIKSEDQGESWFPLLPQIKNSSSAGSTFFNDVFFLTKDKGFIVGDNALLLSTNDGGRTWKDTTFQMMSSSRLNSITFVNDTLGFICGGANTIFRTKNGGANWEKINVDFLGFNRNIVKVNFVNSTIGFAVGDNGIFIKTTDGGTTWKQLQTHSGSGSYFDLFFFNEQIGFITGIYSSGMILKTTDGGNTWNPQWNTFGSPSSSYAVASDPAKKKIIFAGGGSGGDFLGYNGRNILSTTDSGATYNKISANGTIQYNDVFFLNDSTGYITGDNGQSFKTIDYGETWKPLNYVPSLLGNTARSIFFLDDLNGYASTDRIYRTKDGGASWELTAIPGGGQQYFARRLYFFDTLTGVAMDNGTINRTTNGGASWTPVVTLSNNFFTDLWFRPDGKGYAVGYGGIVFTTVDRGATWQLFNLNSTDYLTSVYFFGNKIGFIGSADSTLYKTIDGGNSWEKTYTGINSPMRSFFFQNDSTGFMMRSNHGGISGIYRTKNGGESWSFVRQVTENLSRFSGFQNAYIVGGRGFISKTDRLSAPGIPGYIYGPDLNCENAKSIFMTGPMHGVNYHWTLSGGGVNLFKENMDTVLWNAPGTYLLKVKVSNACGTSSERQTTVIVQPETKIITQPLSRTICDSTQASFTVIATGSSLNYQWMKNGINISGATNSTYTIPVAALRDSGKYSVTVTGLCGSIKSASADLKFTSSGCVTALPLIADPFTTAAIIPNVVRSEAIIKITSRKRLKVFWTITDVNGRTIQNFSSQVIAGENHFRLDVQSLPSGMYQLSGLLEKGGLQVLRFIKL